MNAKTAARPAKHETPTFNATLISNALFWLRRGPQVDGIILDYEFHRPQVRDLFLEFTTI